MPLNRSKLSFCNYVMNVLLHSSDLFQLFTMDCGNTVKYDYWILVYERIKGLHFV